MKKIHNSEIKILIFFYFSQEIVSATNKTRPKLN